MSEAVAEVKRGRAAVGFALVVISYLLWAPVFLFVAMSIGARAWLWGRAAGVTYVLSWLLFLTGFLLAGPEVARAGRHWIARRFRRKRVPDVSDR